MYGPPRPGFSPPSLTRSAKLRRAEAKAAKKYSRINNFKYGSPELFDYLNNEGAYASSKPKTRPAVIPLSALSKVKRALGFNKNNLPTVNQASQVIAATGAGAAALVGLGLVAAPLVPAAVAAGVVAALGSSLLQLQQAFSGIKRDELSRMVVDEIMRTIAFVTMYVSSKSKTSKTRSRSRSRSKSRSRNDVSRNPAVVDAERRLNSAVNNLTAYLQTGGRDSTEIYSRKLLMYADVISSIVKQLIMIK